jgi:hypothetical protein
LIDYGTFSERLEKQTANWELTVSFLKEWNLYEESAEPVESSEITEAETRLGELPQAFKEWLQLPYNPFFIKPRLFWTWLVYPDELEIWHPQGNPEKQFVVFKQEYQQCCEWAFRAEDLPLENPPVYWGLTDDDFPAEEWRKQNNTFSDFMLQLLIVRTVTGAKYCAESDDKSLLQKIPSLYKDMGFASWLEYGEGCRLFGGEDVILLLDSKPPWGDDKILRLAARSLEGLQKAKAAFGIEWDCWSIDGEQQPTERPA